LKGYVNYDRDPDSFADVFTEVPPIPYKDNTVDEIYAGHFLEHLDPSEAAEFLRECYRALVPGGKLGIVVPNIREVMLRWMNETNDEFQVPAGVWWSIKDLDHICNVFLYNSAWSNIDSPHKWSYEPFTLKRAMEEFGFVNLTPIDGYRDTRIVTGAWFNCGFDGYKPE
jgi:SAM-dependent methyltransferase